jgi:polyisoprenoid-binding protein YceI
MLASVNPRSAPSTWTIDERRSALEFTVSYLTVKEVSGRFTRFGGTICVDPDDLEGGWAEVTIDPASVDTGVPDRDRALREDRFLEVARFPGCSYRARRLEPLATGRYRLHGDLTLHGVKRQLDVELTAGAPSSDGGGRRMRFVATGQIDRKLFGVDWNPMFDFVPLFIGRAVQVKITVECVERPR